MSSDDLTNKDPRIDEMLSLVKQIAINLESLISRVDRIESRLSLVEQGVINLGARTESLEDRLEGFVVGYGGNWSSLRTQLTDTKTDI